VRPRLLVLALPLTAAALLAAGAAAAASPERAGATAIGVLVRAPGQGDTVIAGASAPPTARAGVTGYSQGVVAVSAISSSAQTGPGASPRATGVSELSGVSLFGGELTIGRAVGSALATGSGGSATGSFDGSTLEGLVLLGSPLEVGPGTRVDLGFGYAIVLEQGASTEGGRYRGSITALHVYLTQDHGGLPAGSEILVGYAEASAREEVPNPPVPSTVEPASPSGGTDEEPPAGTTGGEQAPGTEPRGSEPQAPAAPPAIVLDPPADVRPQITGRGYVFPVYGAASFSDDFAAPRADTIWHHGNDIFAAEGTPVLAVTSGTLFLVGWNTLGGHRLWLRDDQGNEYYYAHLSAYSPLAVDGARVQAGDVLGFVGQSGVAGGVPHLHFEIHPAALLGLGYDGVINPYTYLLAWRSQQDREFTITLPAQAGGRAPAPGAVLLGVEDISQTSGLDRAGLRRALDGSADLDLPLALG
jgi:hypothetical protein